MCGTESSDNRAKTLFQNREKALKNAQKALIFASKKSGSGVRWRQPTHIGEPVKTTRVCLLLLSLILCLPTLAFAQSNAKPDYKHQHKSAQKYQKSILKQQRKQQKTDEKRAKAYRRQHR